LLVNIDHIGKVKRRTRALAKSNGGNSGFESFPPTTQSDNFVHFPTTACVGRDGIRDSWNDRSWRGQTFERPFEPWRGHCRVSSSPPSRPKPLRDNQSAFGFAASLSTRVDALACDRRQWPGSNVSNIEQTIALHICCLGYHRGIALSGPNPTPPGIIALGGVGLS